jgi:2-polyprenyl-3-methyl-5-hydroxy-6-metoxy-1,4-benzoquinol methylase
MKCRLCRSKSVELHFDFGDQPIVHCLLDSPAQPQRNFPFKVGYCVSCGFMQLVENIAPNELYKNYFTVSSWKNQPHAPRLIQLMESVFDLRERTCIFEIGCNDGSFMEQLVRNGFKNVFGLEPTQDAYDLACLRGLNVTKGFFGHESSVIFAGGGRPDVVVARQVIEHIPDLHEFLGSIFDLLQPEGGLVLELPDHAMNYETLDYTFWEEHVNYFTLNTLTSALVMNGFQVVHHESTLFSGKALFVFAKKRRSPSRSAFPRNIDHERAMRYKSRYPAFRRALTEFLESRADDGIAVYGAGARSGNFVNLLGLKDYVDVFVDDQLEKQYKYVPGCTRLIRPYSEIDDRRRFFLLGVNCENESKVIIHKGLENFASILPPSRHLPDFWVEMSSVGG